jgi:hypothetical protein
MTLRRDELIEQAALEALGLLDEQEAAAFERAFEAAPESVQEQIRRIQAETVTGVAAMSDEEPAPALRGKVLSAVADAIEDEARELQPIASIGVRSRRGQVATAVREERGALRHRGMERQLMVWRAASIALAASLLTTLVLSGVYRITNGSLQQLVDNGASMRQIEAELGTDYGRLLGGSPVIVSLQPQVPNVSGQFLLNETRGAVLLFGLRSNASYTLKLRDDSGERLSVNLTAGPWVTAARIDGLSREALAGCTFELLDDRGTRVLTGSAA